MAMGNEFYLPQALINHIQSFLSARELAQSSALAKSWYISFPDNATLAFDENKFSRPTQDIFSHQFSNYCTETLNRYKTRNPKLEKFTLLMKISKEFAPGYGMTAYDFSLRNKLAGQLITSALELELGVSEIQLKLNYYGDFNCRYDLPAQVFASTFLMRLSVDRYVIDGVIRDRVLCSRLKYLLLNKVKTTDDIIRDILARCPLIENLDLCHCAGIGKLNVSKLIKLVGFRYVEGAGVIVEFMDLDRMNETKFRCLRRLHLEKVSIDAEFFTAFGSMFPCVEDLTLGYCGDYDEISISSHSVRRLKFCEVERLKKVQLNVPNMSKFEFKGTYFKPLPYLSFDNVSMDWESDVQLLRSCNVIDACWFEDLRKFLVQLSRSRISLDVAFTGDRVILGEEIPCFNAIAEVETLKVCTCCSDELNTTERLLLGLSRSCRFNLFTECDECGSEPDFESDSDSNGV